jgi:hypothetical protein
MIDLPVQLTAPAAAAPFPGRAERHPPATAGLGPGPVAPADDGARAAAPQALERAVRAAGQAIFGQREVEVTSFHDPASGRIVCTVADRRSGEVLLQTPPDALLRFFASTRAMQTAPLVAVDA